MSATWGISTSVINDAGSTVFYTQYAVKCWNLRLGSGVRTGTIMDWFLQNAGWSQWPPHRRLLAPAGTIGGPQRQYRVAPTTTNTPQQQKRLEAEEQERQRLLAIERATEKYYAQARWDHFAALVQRQEDTTRQRAFLTAAHGRLGELDEPERSQSEDHLEQMRKQVDEGDPLATPSLLLPQIPEPSESDLEPFMKKRTFYDPLY